MKVEIVEFIEKFFKDLEIEILSLDIFMEKGNVCFVKLKTNESSLLIGNNGRTIESLQRILSMCVNNFSDNKIKLKLEINDYYKSYEEKLFSMVDRSVIFLRKNGGEYSLGNLKPYDRKRIHAYVAKKYTDIISKSRGEGKKRKIFLLFNNRDIKRKLTKLTIDIDGDSI